MITEKQKYEAQTNAMLDNQINKDVSILATYELPLKNLKKGTKLKGLTDRLKKYLLSELEIYNIALKGKNHSVYITVEKHEVVEMGEGYSELNQINKFEENLDIELEEVVDRFIEL